MGSVLTLSIVFMLKYKTRKTTVLSKNMTCRQKYIELCQGRLVIVVQFKKLAKT